jgi:hypothetical protein
MVGELANLRSLRLHFDLYGPATAACVLDGRSPGAASLQELSQDLCLYRWNPAVGAYQILFRGPIGHTQDTVSETTHTVNVQAADYRALIARRPLGGAMTFSQADQFSIAAGLLQGAPGFADPTQPPYDQGYDLPVLTNPDGSSLASTGVLRDRTYTGAEKAGDRLDNLAAVINGFDWGAEPWDAINATPDLRAAKTQVWYPQRGVTKTFVADYGGTVASLSRTVDSTAFANWVRNDGTPNPDGTALFAVAAGDAVTNPQLHPEGWWPEQVSNASTSNPATLAQQAGGQLAVDSILLPSYALTLVPGAWTWKTDCWLGDTVTVRVRSGRLNVDTTARIIQLDVTVDDNGVETVALTVARSVTTLADLLVGQRSELDALSRR